MENIENTNSTVDIIEVVTIKNDNGIIRKETQCNTYDVKIGVAFDNESLRLAVDTFEHNRQKCKKIYGEIGSWNVSQVTDMTKLFYFFGKAYLKKVDLSLWNVQNVKSMCNMFGYCTFVPQGLEHWRTDNVENMRGMFQHCGGFNQNLSKWNVEKVKTMRSMFYCCYKFNAPLNDWKLEKCEDLTRMFHGCLAFNQPLGSWKVTKVKSMNGMFCGAYKFNQSLEKWDVRSCSDFKAMFYRAKAFDQNLSAWKLNSCIFDNPSTSFDSMFQQTQSFVSFPYSWSEYMPNGWTSKFVITLFGTKKMDKFIEGMPIGDMDSVIDEFINGTSTVGVNFLRKKMREKRKRLQNVQNFVDFKKKKKLSHSYIPPEMWKLVESYIV